MNEIQTLMAVLSLGMKILAARVLTFVALAMTFGLFCWAMYLQTVLSCVIAGGFGVAIFLPVLVAGRVSQEKHSGEVQ